MKNCKTCKHWSPDVPLEVEEFEGFGVCNAISELWRETQKKEDYWHVELKPESIMRKAFVTDGENYYARLLTFDSFGCVLHEGK